MGTWRRSSGRGAHLAKRALATAIPNETTPAARLSGEQKEPNTGPAPAHLVSRAPVVSKALANSPGTAASFGSNDETLKSLADVEQAFAGTHTQIEEAQKNTQEFIEQQQQRIDSLWDIVKASIWQNKINDLRARQAMGATDPNYDNQIEEYRKKAEDVVSKSKYPQ